jgi:hypothetical protein
VVAHPGEQGDPRAARRLSEPRPVRIETRHGVPAAIDGVPVDVTREEWRVADRWWTEEPVERRYFEVVLETGRNVVVFRDEMSGGWFRQRA